MAAVLLTMAVAWLVLSVLTTVVCTLIARGGLREDGRRGRLDVELLDGLLHEEADPDLPRPRAGIG